MRKLLYCISLGIMMLLALTGCSKSLYSDEELTQLHDILGYVQERENAIVNVIDDGIISSIQNQVLSGGDYKDLLSTADIDPDKPMLALTFDDGPKNASTSAILDVLEQYNAKATFFVVGYNVGEGTEDTLQRMASLGCQIGNHTDNHKYLTNLDADEVEEEIQNNVEKIKEYAGVDCKLLRPPGGLVNDTVKSLAGAPMIMWDVDTRDWESRDADQIFANIKSYAHDGAIILMHDIYDSTAEAAASAIPWLIDQGYQLVTVSELAYLKGYTLEDGEMYYDFETDTASE